MLTALLLLFATSGMAVSRVTCLLGGHSVVSLGAMDDCCPEDVPTDGPSVRPECCALSSARSGGDPFVGHDVTGIAPLLAVLDNVRPEPMTAVPMVLPKRQQSRPPPLLVPERLAAHGVFLI